MQTRHHTMSKLYFVALLTLPSLLIVTPPAVAQSGSAVERGHAVIEKWCRLCHVRTAAEKSPDMAPPFAEIAARPAHNKSYLRALLDEDHFPMTTYRLFDHEKDDVVAYLLSLKRT